MIQEVWTAGKQSLLNTTNRPEIIMERGKGMYLWDTEGKKYLDFIGGWAVTCLGHCPDEMIKVLDEQGKKLINASPAFYNPPMLEFAKYLTDCCCMDKVFFASSGAEANESAIKLARKHGLLNKDGAYQIITFDHSFHGRTLATMSATGKEAFQKLFEPKVSGFLQLPFNDINAVKNAITSQVCAIMLELVQGEGGVYPAEEAFVQELRQICDENDIVLIFDEVQTGLGRTGKLFAYEHYGIDPDIMTLGKGIGGGYPLSAMLCKEKLDIFDPGDQGGTYTFQPLGMAVGLAVVKALVEKNVSAHAAQMGTYIKEQLTALSGKYGLSQIRGWGLLLAFDLSAPRGAEVVEVCLQKGLLLNAPQPQSIRLMPPLILSKEEADEFIAILAETLDTIFS